MTNKEHQAKFSRLKQLLTREGMSEKFQACYFDAYEPATSEEIARLLEKMPWLSIEYVEFLRTTNGCVLEFFVFYGLGDKHAFSIHGEQWKVEEYGTGRWFVVGHDSSGDTLAINRHGEIGSIGTDPPPDEPILLCDSFDYLIEEICCGKGYKEYYQRSFEKSEWYEFISQQGWS